MTRSAVPVVVMLLAGACSLTQEPGSDYTPVPKSEVAEDCRRIWVEGAPLPEDYKGCWDGRTEQPGSPVSCVGGEELVLFESRFWTLGDAQIRNSDGDVWRDAAFEAALDECLPDGVGYIDDFRRSDRVLDHDAAPTGQRYDVGGDPRGVRLDNGRYAPQVVPTLARILYVPLPGRIKEISASWVFTDTDRSRTSGQNVVIGTTSTAFGGGSVQLAVYAGNWRHHPGKRWQLFVVPRPIVDPYPVLASGWLPRGDETGRTGYQMSMRWAGRNTVVVTLPDGTRERISDKRLGRYWGDIAGYQLRRSTATDGAAQFTFASATSQARD